MPNPGCRNLQVPRTDSPPRKTAASCTSFCGQHQQQEPPTASEARPQQAATAHNNTMAASPNYFGTRGCRSCRPTSCGARAQPARATRRCTSSSAG
jgi:hypothetical protein